MTLTNFVFVEQHMTPDKKIRIGIGKPEYINNPPKFTRKEQVEVMKKDILTLSRALGLMASGLAQLGHDRKEIIQGIVDTLNNEKALQEISPAAG